MPHYGRVSLIEASPNDAGTAYVAVKNYQMDDRAPYLYRTHDYGKTWTKIVNGIAADDYVHAVREDTVRKGLLFAGTEHGIYVSFDDGDTWQSLRLNLPDVQVSDIVMAGNDVVIATHGRSFYVLDDITPMRQFTPTLTSEAAHLFHSTAAERNVGQARIDYYLSKPAQKVVVEIVDDEWPGGAQLHRHAKRSGWRAWGPGRARRARWRRGGRWSGARRRGGGGRSVRRRWRTTRRRRIRWRRTRRD